MAEYGMISEVIQKFGLAFDKKQIFEIVRNYVSRACGRIAGGEGAFAVFAYPEADGYVASVVADEQPGEEALERISEAVAPLLSKYCPLEGGFAEDGLHAFRFESAGLARSFAGQPAPRAKRAASDIRGSLLVPIFLGNRVYSIFGIFCEGEMALSGEDASDLVIIGYMAAMSLKNHSVTRSMIAALNEAERRFSEEAARASRVPALFELSGRLASQKTIEGLMDAAIAAVGGMFGVERVAVYSHNHHRGELVLERSTQGQGRRPRATMPEDFGVAGAAVQKGQPYFRRPYIDDTDEAAVVPLFGVSGISSGAMALYDRSKKVNFEQHDCELVWTVANMLSLAMNSLKVQSVAESRIADRVSPANGIEQLVSLFDEARDYGSLAARAASAVSALFGGAAVTVMEAGEKGGLRKLLGAQGRQEEVEFDEAAVKNILDSSLARTVNGELIVSQGEGRNAAFVGRPFLCLPVSADDGRGLLFIVHCAGGEGAAGAAERSLATQVAGALQSAFDSLKRSSDRLSEARNGSEHAICRQIQKKLVPATEAKFEKYELAAYCEPAAEPGGDFFDMVKSEGGGITLLVSDVSGRGVQSSLISAMLRAQVRALAGGGAEPRRLLHTLNNLICDDIDLYNFVTLILLQLSPGGGRAAFCNAGHNPVIHYVRDGASVVIHESKNSPLGILKNMDFKEGILLLEKGDILLLHTNGLCDVKNPAGEFFGRERLAAFLQENPGSKAAELRDGLVSLVNGFTGGQPLDDDVTFVIVKVV